MADAEFRPDTAGLAAMNAAPFMVETVRHIAEVIRIRAEELAPVRTGAYAFGNDVLPDVTGGGFNVEAGVVDGTARATVSNDVKRGTFTYSIALEVGTDKMPAQHVLGRAVDAAVASLHP